jgi:hypothetical protein
VSEVDRHIAKANDFLERSRDRRDGPRRKRSLVMRAVRAVKFAVIGAGTVLLGAIILGIFVPLGVSGILLSVLAMMVAMVLGALLSREADVSLDKVGKADLKALPDMTARWLDGQRKALPAPAQTLADNIGVKLDILAPQLAALSEAEPAAAEIRRLIADELPELINGYGRVPANLRKEGLNGISPDKQLIDGLVVVDSELKRMSEQLASGDLTQLATQKRYLEIKYQGDEA